MVLTGGRQPAAEDLVQRVFMAVARQWEDLSAAQENRNAASNP
jgi:DNA-directed RNA polymerase specialized sigma24 family protein